jgi:hypothetical protein
VEPVRYRFNQGLLYNLNSSRLVNTFDRMSNDDLGFPEVPKEEIDYQPSIPLKEMIDDFM